MADPVDGAPAGIGSWYTTDEDPAFEVDGELGRGVHGLILSARRKADGESVALKAIRIDQGGTGGDGTTPGSAVREAMILAELGGHRHVISLLGVRFGPGEQRLVLERCATSLQAELRDRGRRNRLPYVTVQTLFKQLAAGVHFLHANCVIHRDLKPANLLLSSRLARRGGRGSAGGGGGLGEGDGDEDLAAGVVLKIADFGLARIFRDPLQPLSASAPVVVTLWYRAPELLLAQGDQTPAIDMWAVGCILGELFNSEPLFRGKQVDGRGGGGGGGGGGKGSGGGPKGGGRDLDREPVQINQLDQIFRVVGNEGLRDAFPGLDQHDQYDQIRRLRSYRHRLHRAVRVDVQTAAYDLLVRLLALSPGQRLTAEGVVGHVFVTAPRKKATKATKKKKRRTVREAAGSGSGGGGGGGVGGGSRLGLRRPSKRRRSQRSPSDARDSKRQREDPNPSAEWSD